MDPKCKNGKYLFKLLITFLLFSISLILSLFLSFSRFLIIFVNHSGLFFIVSLDVQGSLNKFPDFFRMGTFIDSAHMKL